MNRRIPLLLATTFCASLAAMPAATATEVETPKLTMGDIVANGSGCPGGRWVNGHVNADGTGVNLRVNGLVTVVGPKSSPTDGRHNCQLTLPIHVPAGYAYAITEADYSGYMHLEEGASATSQLGLYFQGESSTERLRRDFTSPYQERPFQVVEKLPESAVKWSACGGGRSLNVNLEMRLSPGDSKYDSYGMLSTKSHERSNVHLRWNTRKC